ncbi:MAG: hypothetical protein HYY76_07715 [Acidobacteria bacterium]|nr:hypothetical protein [Acidobacteriota bacterium]
MAKPKPKAINKTKTSKNDPGYGSRDIKNEIVRRISSIAFPLHFKHPTTSFKANRRRAKSRKQFSGFLA